MALLPNINVGTSPNDGTGDSIRTSFTTVNENFQLIGTFFPDTDAANLTANVTSTGTSTFNVLEGSTIGNVGSALVGLSVNITTVNATTLTGTISTADQTNITNVGVLSELTVSGTSNFNTGFVNAFNGLFVAGAIYANITLLPSTLYTIQDSDSTIVANLASLGNSAVVLPNAANSASRTLTMLAYDNTVSSDLVLTISAGAGEGNIFTTANTNFNSTTIGANVGTNQLQVISTGEFWIKI